MAPRTSREKVVASTAIPPTPFTSEDIPADASDTEGLRELEILETESFKKPKRVRGKSRSTEPIPEEMSDISEEDDNVTDLMAMIRQEMRDEADARERRLREELDQQYTRQLDEMKRQLEAYRQVTPSPPATLPRANRTKEEADHETLRDAAEARIRKLIKLRLPKEPQKLSGRDNFMQWRDAMLADARSIKAKEILEQSEPPDTSGRAIARWDALNDVLLSRIETSLSEAIRKEYNEREYALASAIWQDLTVEFGMSPAEERLVTFNAFISVTSQGNMSSAMEDLKRLYNQLKSMNYTLDDLYRDKFICLLGTWQSSFVQTKLDEYFADSRKGTATLDVEEMAVQLRARSNPSTKPYTKQSFKGFKLGSGFSPYIPTTQTPAAHDKATCKHCKWPQNKPEDCWTLHPDKRPKDGTQRSRSNKPKDDKQSELKTNAVITTNLSIQQPNDLEIVRRQKHEPSPTTTIWRLDSCASEHVTGQKDLFIILEPFKSKDSTEDAGGTIHQYMGKGDVKINGNIQIPDVFYVPTLRTNLLSRTKLRQQGFKFELEDDGTQDIYHITSPDGVRFKAIPDKVDKCYRLTFNKTQFDKAMAVIPFQGDMNSEPRRSGRHRQPTRTAIESTETEAIYGRKISKPVKQIIEQSKPLAPEATIEQWHRRLSHTNARTIHKLANQGILRIKGSRRLRFCDTCHEANITRTTSHEAPIRSARRLGRIFIDIVDGGQVLGCDEPEAPPGLKNVRYYLLITDDATRFRWAFPLRKRSEAVSELISWMRHLHSLGYGWPAFVRADREFITEELRKFMFECGSKLEPTDGYSSHQNGPAERGNRTISARIRTQMHDAPGLPRYLWPQALEMAIEHTNLLPTRVSLYSSNEPGATSDTVKPCDWITPANAWNDKSVGLRHLVHYGAPAWLHRHRAGDSPDSKFDSRGRKVYIVAYKGQSSYVAFDPEKKELLDVHDVDINEWDADTKVESRGGDNYITSQLSLVQIPKITPIPTFPEPETKSHDITATVLSYLTQSEDDEPIRSDDDFVRPAKSFAVIRVPKPQKDIPTSYRDARTRPDWKDWYDAMVQEVETLDKMNAWELIRRDELPSGARPIPGRWVYDKRHKPDGSIRKKARWVIRGNLLDLKDTEYGSAYAPVVDPTTTRILLAAAAYYGWTVLQADAKLAFINGNIKGDIFMYQPIGFEQGEKGTLVCRLLRSLYGLVPAARIWYDTLIDYLKEIGFRVSPYDAALYLRDEAGRRVYIDSHVDDFKVIAERAEDAQNVINQLKSRFEMKDVEQLRRYLGMEIIQDEKGIFISQTSYIDELVESFGLADAHTYKTPLDPGLRIDDDPDPTINIKEYQRGTGSLQFLSDRTRADICRSASMLAEYNTKPTMKCWSSLMHVLKYLKGTRTKGIQFYSRKSRYSSLVPIGYTDSDWGGPLTPARRSVSGNVFMMAGGPIAWRSQRQTCVATSSNEAEYIAASEAARSAVWIRNLINDMGLDGVLNDEKAPPMTLYMDNKGAIDLTTALGATKRSKHIDIRYHYVRDMVNQGVISIRQVPSAEMAADGFTKVLDVVRHTRFLDLIGLSRH
jgi:hypothetical protein